MVKCADYYGVTTDYLLGVSASRNGLDPSVYASLGAEDDDMPLSTLSQATRILLDTAAAASRGALPGIFMITICSACTEAR